MKSEPDIIRDFLLSLLQDPEPAGFTPSGNVRTESVSQPQSGDEPEETYDLLSDVWDPLDAEMEAFMQVSPSEQGHLFNGIPVNHLGDLSAVQDRFQALLKRRLRLEIERRPPLFPWEKEFLDYPEYSSEEVSRSLWLAQLRQLAIPTVLPDEVLVTLLERCQDIAQQPLKSGLKLIQAVEVLFPDQAQTLDRVARMVLTPAYRSQRTLDTLQIDYDQANPQQQVALTMLAAQEILSALALSVSRDEPTQEREWLTSSGLMRLNVAYDIKGHISIRATLPRAGYLRLVDLNQDLRAEQVQTGELLLTIETPQLNHSYLLEVGMLDHPDVRPLQFTLQATD